MKSNETRHFIGMGRIEAKVYYKEASKLFRERTAGWYYSLSVMIGDTGETLDGQVRGPFDSERQARETALCGYADKVQA